jgi:hypothetical protein
VISLLAPLVRDPGRPRLIRTPDAAGIAAGILGGGGERAGRSDTHRGAGDGDQSLNAVSALVYDLPDAHQDTARMAAWFRCDPDWREHLERLQALQRTGSETLAHLCLDNAR